MSDDSDDAWDPPPTPHEKLLARVVVVFVLAFLGLAALAGLFLAVKAVAG